MPGKFSVITIFAGHSSCIDKLYRYFQNKISIMNPHLEFNHSKSIK